MKERESVAHARFAHPGKGSYLKSSSGVGGERDFRKSVNHSPLMLLITSLGVEKKLSLLTHQREEEMRNHHEGK